MGNAAFAVDDSPIKTTMWFNPLQVEQRISLVLDGIRRTVAWKPGERKELPGLHDRAVQTVVNGVVIGGQAPALVNESLEQPPRLHEELDMELQAKKAKAAAIGAAVVTAHVARDLASIAEEVATAPEPKPAAKK